jgi:hypothetical protein
MAIEQKYVELINADIDGEISSAAKTELQAFLDSNDEGRALHTELAALCGTLAEVPAEEPPVHLRHVIMNSLPPVRKEKESPSFFRSLLMLPALRYVGTFAAGVFFTISIVNSSQLTNQAFDDVTGLVGTIAQPINSSLASAITVSELAIAGTVSLRSAGSLLILDFDLASGNPIEIEADYEDNSVWFNGFAQLESTGTTISADTGRVLLGMEGKRRYALYLHNQGNHQTTIKLRFMADGEVVHEASLAYKPSK